jgi:hypothetical protein
VPHEYSSHVLGQVFSSPFFLPVQNAAAESAAKDIPNITLRVEATGVGMILPDSPVALKVVLAK